MTNVITHRRINLVLAGLVVLLGAYIALSPFLPAISYWWNNRGNAGLPAYATVPSSNEQNSDAPTPQPPTDNRLIIPSIRLDENILTGNDENTVNNGVWLRPETVPPNTFGNSVLVGHRFTYSASVKDTFYHLDKVKVGDKIIVYWNKEPQVFKVSEIRIVPPTAIEIESQNVGDRLTLYTCTPLWSSANRLVVIADRETEVQQ